MSDALRDIAARLLTADRLHHGEGNAHDRLSHLAASIGQQLLHDGRPCVWSRLLVVAALGFVRQWRAEQLRSSTQEAAGALVMRTLCYVHEAEDGRLEQDTAPAHAASGLNHQGMAE